MEKGFLDLSLSMQAFLKSNHILKKSCFWQKKAALAFSTNFEEISSACREFLRKDHFFLIFFPKFSEKLLLTTVPDGSFCIEKTYKAVNTPLKLPVKAHIFRKKYTFYLH